MSVTRRRIVKGYLGDKLPEELRHQTVALWNDVVDADYRYGKTSIRTKRARARFAAWRERLLDAHYSLRAIGEALGMSGEGVRQVALHYPELVAEAEEHADLPDVESAPRDPNVKQTGETIPVRLPAHRREVPDDVAVRLADLCEASRYANDITPIGLRRTIALEEFVAEITDLVSDGYSYAAIARAAGVTPTALMIRLSRAGFPTSDGYLRMVEAQRKNVRNYNERRGEETVDGKVPSTQPG